MAVSQDLSGIIEAQLLEVCSYRWMALFILLEIYVWITKVPLDVHIGLWKHRTLYIAYTSLPSHYIILTQIQYILIISIAWEFATN